MQKERTPVGWGRSTKRSDMWDDLWDPVGYDFARQVLYSLLRAARVLPVMAICLLPLTAATA